VLFDVVLAFVVDVDVVEKPETFALVLVLLVVTVVVW